MEAYTKNLGRTAFECRDEHSDANKYKKGSIVYKTIDGIVNSFLSRRDVPYGISLDNEDYWQPFSLTIEYI